MKNRFFSVFIAALMLMSSFVYASATDEGSTSLQSASEEVALSFMRNSLGKETDIEIQNTTPFYDLDGKVTAYCVSFLRDSKPGGYVLISLITSGDPIVEFSFEGPSIADVIQEDSIMNISRSNADTPIYYLGPEMLFLQGSKSTTVEDVITGEEHQKEVVNAMYKDQLAKTPMPAYSNGEGILDWADSNINSSSIYKITGFGNGSDYWLMDELSDGSVCAPTAATNVIWYWGVQRGRDWVLNSSATGYNLASIIFNQMKRKMWTSTSLGTLDSAVRGAYVNYLEPKGKNYNTKILTQNSYSSFVAALNDNCPVHTMLRPSSSITAVGHDVMTFGYGKSKTGTNYLFVMDGWFDYGRFVKFSYYPIIKGVKVWVGEL